MLYFVTLNSSSQSKQLAKFEVFIRVSSTQRPGYHKDPIFNKEFHQNGGPKNLNKLQNKKGKPQYKPKRKRRIERIAPRTKQSLSLPMQTKQKEVQRSFSITNHAF